MWATAFDRLPGVDVIFSGDKSKQRVVSRFAPKANPEYHVAEGEAELMTVIGYNSTGWKVPVTKM
jgi:hypothetical protein